MKPLQMKSKSIFKKFNWHENYLQIAGKLSLDIERDIEAAHILDNILENSKSAGDCEANLKRLEDLIYGKRVFVFGAGPSLDSDIEIIKNSNFLENSTIIAADGASGALASAKIIPDIVVTDLDGDIDALLRCANSGSIMLIHAHGDNTGKIKKYTPLFCENGKVIGTTQTDATTGHVHNFGGFTDGDRCVFLGEYFSARSISLFGMDFGTVIGAHSKKQKLDEIQKKFKIKKLEIASRLISELSSKFSNIINSTSGSEIENKNKNIPQIKLNELENTYEIKPGIKIVGLSLHIVDTLIIGDIHLGFERYLQKTGYVIAGFQYPDTIGYLGKIFLKLKFLGLPAKTIIINGDLEHEFGTISSVEWRDTLNFLEFISRNFENIVLVKGNHDTILQPIIEFSKNKRKRSGTDIKNEIQIMDYVIIDDAMIIHGHKIPGDIKFTDDFKKIKTIIIGHVHPAISLRDDMRQERLKSYLLGKFRDKDLIIIPALNTLSEGSDILVENYDEKFSPFTSDSGFEKFEIFAVDRESADEVMRFGTVGDFREYDRW